MLAASSRLYELALPRIIQQWGGRLARIAWTEEETKMYCKIKYRADEQEALCMLQDEGSISSSIYAELHLTRSIIKEVLTRLRNDRRKQMVFASVVCATRFRTYTNNNEPQTVKCMRCGNQDSFEHLLQCSRATNIPSDGQVEELLDYLVGLTREAAKGAPLIPVRLPLPEIDEISLTAPDDDDRGVQTEEESMASLSFDQIDINDSTAV